MEDKDFVNLFFNSEVQGTIYFGTGHCPYTLVWNYPGKPNVHEYYPSFIKAFAALRSRTQFPLHPLRKIPAPVFNYISSDSVKEI